MKKQFFTLIMGIILSFSVNAQENVIYGPRALPTNNGFENTAIGFKTLLKNIDGIRNTAIGSQALRSNLTGKNNAALGHKALSRNTYGSFNVAIGTEALYTNYWGSWNTALGNRALISNSNGNYNVALGFEAMDQNSTGSDNVGIGRQSLFYNNGTANIGIGTMALFSNTTGLYNSALGYSSLHNLTTGTGNIGIGHLAGYNITTGSNNIVIGYQCNTLPVAASNNIVIGYQAGCSTMGGNNIIIGKNISLNNGTNNGMNIGGLLYGFNLYDNTNGKLGINQQVPTATLDVAGDAKISSTLNVTGHVGIGSIATDPTGAMLTVKGKIHTTEVIVDLNAPVADYVFDTNYTLMPLNKVESYVKENKHLPEIPSATEVSQNGMNMGEMQNKLLQKVEELTLYVIEQQKTINQQSAKIEELEKKIK